jgi:hypothetical protein
MTKRGIVYLIVKCLVAIKPPPAPSGGGHAQRPLQACYIKYISLFTRLNRRLVSPAGGGIKGGGILLLEK